MSRKQIWGSRSARVSIKFGRGSNFNPYYAHPVLSSYITWTGCQQHAGAGLSGYWAYFQVISMMSNKYTDSDIIQS